MILMMEERKYLGFDVDLGRRNFKIPTDKWETF